MPFLTFPASPLPDFPETVQAKFTTLESMFGDGYSVEAPAGLNSRTDMVSMRWSDLTKAERDIIINFLDAHAPAKGFLYVSPFGWQKVFKCKDYTCVNTNGNLYTIDAPFVQLHGWA